MVTAAGVARFPLFVIFAALILSACDRSDAGKGRGENSPTGQNSPAEPRLTLTENYKDARISYITIKSTIEKNTIVSFFPDPIGSVDEREWWIIATEGKPPKPGLTAITWKIDRVQSRHRDMVGRERKPDQVFDSLRPNASQQATTYGPWIDRAILFWLNPRGDVDQMIDPPSAKPPLPRAGAGQQAEAPTADEFQHMANEFYGLYLPDHPVAVNDKWTRPYSVKRAPYGALNGPITFTLKSVEKRGDQTVARIEFSGNLKLVPETQPARPGADDRRYEIRTAVYEGWAEFDADAGVPIGVDSREEVKMDLIMTAAATPPPKAASQPTTKPAAKPVSYSFQLAETRRNQFSVTKTPPPKPIVVHGTPPPATAPAYVRPPVTTYRATPPHPGATAPRSPPPLRTTLPITTRPAPQPGR